eukprot:1630910-Rhodomonas_salina.1
MPTGGQWRIVSADSCSAPNSKGGGGGQLATTSRGLTSRLVSVVSYPGDPDSLNAHHQQFARSSSLSWASP